MFGLTKGGGASSVDSIGGQASTSVNDDEAINTLHKILKELKILNVHQSLITSHEIDKTEVNN